MSKEGHGMLMRVQTQIIPAQTWFFLRLQADSESIIKYSGLTLRVVDELRVPWSRENPPFIIGQNDMGVVFKLVQGLPVNRLTMEEAEEAESVLRQRPGWRRHFFQDQTPSWSKLDGHPVAVYFDDQGKRWASIPYRFRLGGVQEILLAKDVLLDEERARQQPVQLELDLV